MRALVALGFLLALAACSDDARSLAPLLNRCSQPFECVDSYCDELGICAQERATLPYDYRVKVTPTLVTDAGQQASVTTARASLRDAGDLGEIVVPRAVTVSGCVQPMESTGCGTTIEAELAFTPSDDNSLGGTRSVFTRRGAKGQAFAVQLEPNRSYAVRVYPRGADSAKYPPYDFELPPDTADRVIEFTYDQVMTSLRGQIVDEDEMPAREGQHVKTRYRDRLLASSSIGTLDAQGKFELFLPQSVLASPSEHELVLELSNAQLPQNVEVALDLTKARPDGPWVIPVVPEPVVYTGTVETAFQNPVNAELTFLSSFELPSGNMGQRQADWCQLRRPGAPRNTFRCSAYVASSVGPDLMINARLLPGAYQFLIAPSSAAPSLQRLALDLVPLTVQSQPDGMQGPEANPLTYVTQYKFFVKSPGNREMPSVEVSATALGVRADLPEIALYNRSDRQTTVHDGTTTLAIDVGIYDLLAAPPEGSGYAWVLQYNRRIARPLPNRLGEVEVPERTLLPELPVVLRGSAVTPDDRPVVEANVDAYAMVPDLEGGPDRAVRIAHTTTDRDGKFALQMPPRIGSDDDVVNDGGVADAGGDAQR